MGGLRGEGALFAVGGQEVRKGKLVGGVLGSAEGSAGLRHTIFHRMNHQDLSILQSCRLQPSSH